MSNVPARSLRIDAARNRDRVLDAARIVFAEQGGDAPLEEIARVADVSRTTLYRNFASRDELMAVIYDENVGRIEQRSEELVSSMHPEAIITLFDYVFDELRDDRSFGLTVSTENLAWLEILHARTAAAFEPLIERGRRNGVVHSDITSADIMMSFPMAQGVMAVNDAAGREVLSERVRTLLHRALFKLPTGS